jgi:glycosyltransferase involved in cell wall biosynthesis
LGFCVVGRLSREKGFANALEAARLGAVALTVAGDGPIGAELRARYPEFEFMGRLDALGVAALVERSLAVIVPSVCLENAPMSVLEAMAEGTSVIASAIGGIPEQVTDGVNGLLVKAGDIAAIATAMRRLADEEGLARRLGAEAQRTVAERFSPERHLEGLIASYRATGAPA